MENQNTIPLSLAEKVCTVGTLANGNWHGAESLLGADYPEYIWLTVDDAQRRTGPIPQHGRMYDDGSILLVHGNVAEVITGACYSEDEETGAWIFAAGVK